MEKKCLNCSREVILEQGMEYCKYCGTPVINSCSNYNCGVVLDDDAAFCPFCGEKSTFNNAGIVSPSCVVAKPKPKMPF